MGGLLSDPEPFTPILEINSRHESTLRNNIVVLRYSDALMGSKRCSDVGLAPGLVDGRTRPDPKSSCVSINRRTATTTLPYNGKFSDIDPIYAHICYFPHEPVFLPAKPSKLLAHHCFCNPPLKEEDGDPLPIRE